MARMSYHICISRFEDLIKWHFSDYIASSNSIICLDINSISQHFIIKTLFLFRIYSLCIFRAVEFYYRKSDFGDGIGGFGMWSLIMANNFWNKIQIKMLMLCNLLMALRQLWGIKVIIFMKLRSLYGYWMYRNFMVLYQL